MNIELQTLPKSEIKVTVSFTPEELKSYEQKAAEALQEHVNVSGFRKGHVPFDVLKEHVGEQAFLGQTLDMALSESYEQAVKEKELRPVAYPKIQILSSDPFKYEATVAVLPELKFKKDPSTLRVKREQPVVEPKDVEEVIANFLDRSKAWKDVERAAQMGDRVEIDFDGFDEAGVALDGTSSKNHPVVLGSGSLIPGFEEEIVGMKKDEAKDFWITFPKDYHSDAFKGKKVQFKIKLNRIEEGAAQTPSDEWAKEVSGEPEKTFDALKEDVKEELKKQKGFQEDQRLEELFLKKILEHAEAEIPEALIEKEIDFMIDRLKEDLKRQKKDWAEYEKELAAEKKDLRSELKKPALEQVLLRLGLEKLMELENPQAEESDIADELERILGRYPAEFRAMLQDRYLPGTEGHDSLQRAARFKKLLRTHTDA